MKLEPPKIQHYPPRTTSFAKYVSPVRASLRGRGALLVADHLARVELVVRQLAREGLSPGEAGTMVLTTGEGADEKTIGRAGSVLDGVWIAPVAATEPGDSTFVTSYRELAGTPPGDQALLVWRALSTALGRPGAAAHGSAVALRRIREGTLVRESTSRAKSRP